MVEIISKGDNSSWDQTPKSIQAFSRKLVRARLQEGVEEVLEKNAEALRALDHKKSQFAVVSGVTAALHGGLLEELSKNNPLSSKIKEDVKPLLKAYAPYLESLQPEGRKAVVLAGTTAALKNQGMMSHP
jgi:hypothetical protein